MLDLLFSKVTAVTPGAVIKNAYVGVKAGKIAYVGTERPEEKPSSVIDGRNCALMPGLVNAHTHMSMTAFRGYGDGHNLHDWLNDFIFPCEEKMTPRQAALAAEMALLESIACGTTAIADMYFFYDDTARIFAECGINANLSRGTNAFFIEDDFRETAAYAEQTRLWEQFGGYGDGRIIVDASIHAEYTSNEKLWRPMAEIAAERGQRLHIHVSETREEHDKCFIKHGKTPTELFDSYGLLKNALLAHGTYLSENDGGIIAANGASVAHCPASNLKLASGVAPVPRLSRQGVNVALGTDGASSNDGLDMFAEMKLASILHRGASLDPLAVTSNAALRMATENGARALGRADTGKIEEGMYADLIMLDLDRPHLYPHNDERALAVYSAKGSDVCLTMARGRILYKDGEWTSLDAERIKRRFADEMASLFAE